jgi:pimeloyl-ACP methyl ester carboxylesterase
VHDPSPSVPIFTNRTIQATRHPTQNRRATCPLALTPQSCGSPPLRPSQIRAISMDGALMIPVALGLCRHYKDLTLPVIILAGDGDKVVFKHRAEQLRNSIRGSVLQIVKGAGHMVHHVAPQQVAQAVESVTAASRMRAQPDRVADSGTAARELAAVV